jgi:hypothetical protein
MDESVSSLERAEQIKWFDALDEVVFDRDIECGLASARESQHPDAKWLASLFAVGEAVSPERMLEVMLQHDDDPRAMYLAFMLQDDEPDEDDEWDEEDEEREDEKRDMLVRAAEMGYAPAQTKLSMWYEEIGEEDDAFAWSQRGAAQGDRLALHQLGYCYRHGVCCAVDDKRGIELYGQSAALDCKPALHDYGLYAFGHLDWERYYWWERAASRDYMVETFYSAVVTLVPSFEEGHNSRILHIVAPLIRSNFECSFACGWPVERELLELERVIELHDAMLDRAQSAISCWSIVGRRCGVVKDIRIVIAKMAWEEVWVWGETKSDESKTKERRTD